MSRYDGENDEDMQERFGVGVTARGASGGVKQGKHMVL